MDKMKTFEQCCDGAAYILYGMAFDEMLTVSCIKGVMQEAAELYNQETAAERDNLNVELSKAEDVIVSQIKKIDSLKQLNSELLECLIKMSNNLDTSLNDGQIKQWKEFTQSLIAKAKQLL